MSETKLSTYKVDSTIHVLLYSWTSKEFKISLFKDFLNMAQATFIFGKPDVIFHFVPLGLFPSEKDAFTAWELFNSEKDRAQN